MNDNPFEFGIMQRVRRLFRREPDPVDTLMDYLDDLSDVHGALIAVIEQWGPITFASETIEANKKKKISIVHQDGFVKFRIEGQPQEWPDESRIDIIGSNGNDGDHYAQG